MRGTALASLHLPAPILLGSFDALVDADTWTRCFELGGAGLGAVVTKSTTLDARSGYSEPRVAHFGQGLLVASGNPNPGIRRMAAEVRKFRQSNRSAVLIGSIVSDPDQPHRKPGAEYAELALEYARAGVNGVELNLSCPHHDPHDRQNTIVPAQDPDQVAGLVGAVREALSAAGLDDRLVIPKLTGWNCDLVAVARAAEHAGAHAVTVSNLFPGTGYHTGLGQHADSTRLVPGDCLLAHGKGGVTGKAMHAAVLLLVANLRRVLGIPIIATGGCATDLDSLVQTFMAGATAVAGVTPFYFRDAGGMERLRGLPELVVQLDHYLRDQGLQDTNALFQLRMARERR